MTGQMRWPAEAPPLAEELLVVDGCWGEETHFSLVMWPLVGCPCLSGWPPIHLYVVNTNYPQWATPNNNNGLEGGR